MDFRGKLELKHPKFVEKRAAMDVRGKLELKHPKFVEKKAWPWMLEENWFSTYICRKLSFFLGFI